MNVDEMTLEYFGKPAMVIGAILIGFAIGKVIYDNSTFAKQEKDAKQKAKDEMNKFLGSVFDDNHMIK